jgi:hypothetical protein
MMSFEIEDPREHVDEYLRTKYGFGLSYFEFSLKNITSFYSLIELKKNKPLFEEEINILETEKRLLIERIDDFLIKVNLWDDIKHNQLEGAILTSDRKVSYIKSNFGLDIYFEKIDEKLKSYKKRVVLLRSFQIETEEKHKRIEPQTLIALVWYLAVQFGENTKSQKFEDVAKLMNWFFHNEIEDMMNLFREPIEMDASAIKNDYERYIQNPNEIQRIYHDLAFSIYGESFSDIEE